MQYTEGRMGRVFVLRLEDGERLNDTLEAFARDHHLAHALAFYLGGSATGSQVVVGPDANRPDAVVPLVHMLSGSQEVLALGTLTSDEDGGAGAPHARRPQGREGRATVGCTRAGVDVCWWAKWSCWKSWEPTPGAGKTRRPDSSS